MRSAAFFLALLFLFHQLSWALEIGRGDMVAPTSRLSPITGFSATSDKKTDLTDPQSLQSSFRNDADFIYFSKLMGHFLRHRVQKTGFGLLKEIIRARFPDPLESGFLLEEVRDEGDAIVLPYKRAGIAEPVELRFFLRESGLLKEGEMHPLGAADTQLILAAGPETKRISQKGPVIEGPYNNHDIVLDKLIEFTGAEEKIYPVLVLNFDQHHDKYNSFMRNPPRAAVWAVEAEARRLARVPHFPPEDTVDEYLEPVLGWKTEAFRRRMINFVKDSRERNQELWVTIDYDFFNPFLRKTPADRDGIKKEIQEIRRFLEETGETPRRLIPVISRGCLKNPNGTIEDDIKFITESIKEVFLQQDETVSRFAGRAPEKRPDVPGEEKRRSELAEEKELFTGDASWHSLEEEGYWIEELPALEDPVLKTPSFRVNIHSLEEDGRKWLDIEYLVVPETEDVIIRNFYPNFPEQKKGRGRALLRYIMARHPEYAGYRISALASPTFQSSFLKMQEYDPMADLEGESVYERAGQSILKELESETVMSMFMGKPALYEKLQRHFEELTLLGRIPPREELELQLQRPHKEGPSLSRKTDREVALGFVREALISTGVGSSVEKPVIIGIDTAWIPELQKNIAALNTFIARLKTDLRGKRGLENLVITSAEGERALTERIAYAMEEQKERGYSLDPSNVLVISEKNVILEEENFAILRKDAERSAFFVGVVLPEAFPEQGDIMLLRIITGAMTRAYGRFDGRYWEVSLSADVLSLQTMRERYDVQWRAIESAL